MAGGCWGVNQSSRIIRLEGVLLARQGSLYTASVVGWNGGIDATVFPHLPAL